MDKARVLIVDDTYDIVRTLELLLQDRYEVISAPDGLVGFTKALRYLPDLIVLDIMMPKMTGYQFCDQLKKNPTLYNIPIVFLSAKGTRIDQEYGIKKGAAAYVPKPFEPQILLNVIADLLQQNPQGKKNRPNYEQILIDESKENKVNWKG